MEGSAGSNTVTPFELAVLVLHYLDFNGYKKTAQSFRREAKSVLGSAAVSLPPGVKNLQELLNEYVTSAERDTRRQALQAANPVAQSLFSLLDFHAGLPTPQTLPPAFYASAAPPPPPTAAAAAAGQAGRVAQQQQQVNQAMRGLAPLLVPVQAGDLSYPSHHTGLGPQQQQQQMAVGQLPGAAGAGQHTPGRHAHRKGAPKRRRLEELGAGGGGGCSFGAGPSDVQGSSQHVLPIVSPPGAGGATGGGGCEGLRPLDLLNMPLDEEGLMSLLCDDDLQVRFASGLAQHITTAINHQLPGADSAGLGGEDHLVVGSIEDVLAELPADPAMAELLQQFVRCDGGGTSLASPPATSQEQRRPGSKQQQQVQTLEQQQPSQQREAPLEPHLPNAPEQMQQEHGAGEASTAQQHGKVGQAQAATPVHSQQLSQHGEEALPSQLLLQELSPSQQQQQEAAGNAGMLPWQPSMGAGEAMPPPQQLQQGPWEGPSQPQQPLQQGKAPSVAGSQPSETGGPAAQQAQQATPMQEEALAMAASSSGAAAEAPAQSPAVQQKCREPSGNAGCSSARQEVPRSSGQESLPQLGWEGSGSGQEAGDSQEHGRGEGEPGLLACPPREAGASAATPTPEPVTEQALAQCQGSPRPGQRQSSAAQSCAFPRGSPSQRREAAQLGLAGPQQQQAQLEQTQERQEQHSTCPAQELQVQQSEVSGDAAATVAREPLQPLAGNSLEAGQPERVMRLDFSTQFKAVLGGTVVMDAADMLLDELGFDEGAPAAAREPLQPGAESTAEAAQHRHRIDFSSYVEGSLGGAVAMDAADALLDELDF